MDMEKNEPVYKQAEIRESRLPINNQEKALAELHDTISQLERNLVSILTPGLTQAANDETEDASPPVSPLAKQLHDHNELIQQASHRLCGVIERLEA